MSGKSSLVVLALMLSGLGTASAKSYNVTIPAPSMAGATELKAGEYKLKVEGSQAVFTDVPSGKSISVPVKVENSDKKYSYTLLETEDQNGMNIIRAIDLEGSNTRLTVGQ